MVAMAMFPVWVDKSDNRTVRGPKCACRSKLDSERYYVLFVSQGGLAEDAINSLEPQA